MITKEEFLKVYNKYLPNKLSVWFYKYFSESTKPEDKKVVNRFTLYMVISIFLGIIFSALEIPVMRIISLLLFSIPFVIFISIGLFSVISNRMRIRKIANKLGVKLVEYNKLVDKYL